MSKKQSHADIMAAMARRPGRMTCYRFGTRARTIFVTILSLWEATTTMALVIVLCLAEYLIDVVPLLSFTPPEFSSSDFPSVTVALAGSSCNPI